VVSYFNGTWILTEDIEARSKKGEEVDEERIEKRSTRKHEIKVMYEKDQ
jgi:hypothetical protein